VQREIPELLGQQAVLPGRDLGQPVIGNPKGAGLLRSEVIEAQRRHLSSAQQATCEIPTVPGDNIVRTVDQHRDVEIKCVDTVSNLPDLLLGVAPRVCGIWFQRVDSTVHNLQTRIPVQAMFRRSQS
jgi:hypothetical protein